MSAMSRRQLLASAAASATAAYTSRLLGQTRPSSAPTGRIDRRALVGRHDVTLTAIDPLCPLQVGNGEFAFSCDVTGLQTLVDHYRAGTPLNTMAQWAWHAFPNPDGFDIEQLRHEYRTFDGRTVPYFHDGEYGTKPSPAGTYLRGNPHRLALCRLGLVHGDGTPVAPDELSNVRQTLDLWAGAIRSSFDVRGAAVRVVTAAHPTRDLVAVRVESAALARGALAVRVAFPAPSAAPKPADDPALAAQYPHDDLAASGGAFVRSLDETRYHERLAFEGFASARRVGPDAFVLTAGGDHVELVAEFAQRSIDAPSASVDQVVAAAAAHWPAFWNGGAAIDFAACADPRAPELERRVVLSQYLTAVNCAGSLPPQETGLLYNTWSGKHHLEMHWWHAAHFAMWGRLPLLERSLGYYDAILPAARRLAELQGYDGVRWPKMTDPAGRDTPSQIGAMLIWQQPHPIYYAEQAYRARPTRATLDRFATIVEETAKFMASYAAYDAPNDRYVLGPPFIDAQESHFKHLRTNMNATYELAYWAWGLGVANAWRERLGRPREARWDAVGAKLSRPTTIDGHYVTQETQPQLLNAGHPSFLGAYGFVPKTHLIDESTMRETVRWTMANWKWPPCWGWDFPLIAQTAVRVGEPALAVDALCLDAPKNRFLANGHNHQSDALTLYLPGNGALLAAIAMMAGGWDGGPDGPAPGFPKDGQWDVRCEGFARVI